MELVVDLSTGGVELRHRDDMGRFSVQAQLHRDDDGEERGALGALAAALSVHDAGTVDPDGHVFVPAQVVRRLADDAARQDHDDLGSDWDEAFAAMLHAAGTRGWIADDGSIKAHVEWANS
jgi:hypothetical protein